jgi:hypothetical protein
LNFSLFQMVRIGREGGRSQPQKHIGIRDGLHCARFLRTALISAREMS